MHPHTTKLMETNTNTPEAKQPASAGCHPTTCSSSSELPYDSNTNDRTRSANRGTPADALRMHLREARHVLPSTLGCRPMRTDHRIPLRSTDGARHGDRHGGLLPAGTLRIRQHEHGRATMLGLRTVTGGHQPITRHAQAMRILRRVRVDVGFYWMNAEHTDR